IQSVHLANIACGFHASDFTVMNDTVLLAKKNSVSIGAHPSLPDLQGFGRREMAITPVELKACLTYQVGALCGFLLTQQQPLNHVKLHGALYGQTARDPDLADAAVSVIPSFYPIAEFSGAPSIAFLGLAGTEHQRAARDKNVPFLAGKCATACTNKATLPMSTCQNGLRTLTTMRTANSSSRRGTTPSRSTRSPGV
ncbi:hypothetical protein HETIRDRAFT_328194, partial [Heterobasidion irregulare TC 32-1]